MNAYLKIHKSKFCEISEHRFPIKIYKFTTKKKPNILCKKIFQLIK